MKKWLGLALGAVVIATGCNGFPRPMPIAEAEYKPEKYPTYTEEPAVLFAAGQQRWIMLPGATTSGPTWAFQPVGGPLPVLRLAWDEEPFDQLYGRGTDGLLHIAAELR